MSAGRGTVWVLLGIPETRDERVIKKAYARRLRERRPEEDAEAFQQLRWAYETALSLALGSDAPKRVPFPEGRSSYGAGPPLPEIHEDEEKPPPPIPPSPTTENPSSLPPRPDLHRQISQMDSALRLAGVAAAAEQLTEILRADLSIASQDELEGELARWLRRLDEPPSPLVRAVAERFRWRERYFQVGGGLPMEANSLVAQLQREEQEERSRREMSDAPGSWSFYRGLFQTLLALMMPVLLLRRMPPGSDRFYEGLQYLGLLAPALVEVGRALIEPRLGRFFKWLPALGLWAILCFALAAQVQLHSTNYPLWWASSLLAILLSFRERLPLGLVMLEVVGYAVFLACLVQPIQGPSETPFAYFFALPLLLSRESLFGPWNLDPEIGLKVLSPPFLLMAWLSSQPPENVDARKIFLGFTLVLLVLYWRQLGLRPTHLLLLCPLPWLIAKLFGTTLYASPRLLMLHLAIVLAGAFLARRRLAK